MKRRAQETEEAMVLIGRRWQRRLMVLFLLGTFSVVVGLSVWSMYTPFSVISAKVEGFAAIMRVVRPLILFLMLMLWRPVFAWLAERSWVRPETARRAIDLWPRLAIWVGLIELTMGQGFVLIGLALTTVYWFVLRKRIG